MALDHVIPYGSVRRKFVPHVDPDNPEKSSILTINFAGEKGRLIVTHFNPDTPDVAIGTLITAVVGRGGSGLKKGDENICVRRDWDDVLRQEIWVVVTDADIRRAEAAVAFMDAEAKRVEQERQTALETEQAKAAEAFAPIESPPQPPRRVLGPRRSKVARNV